MDKDFSIGEKPKQIFVKGKIYFNDEKCINIEKTINDLIKENAYIYWQCAKFVDFGLYKNGEILLNNQQMDFENIQELRIFNENFELHFWKQNRKLKYRHIKDEVEVNDKNKIKKNITDVINDFSIVSKGEYEQVAISQKVKLWGTDIEESKTDNNFSKVSEDRGMKISIPIPFDKIKMPKKHESIFIKEHRYICYDELNLAYFIDRRLCGFYTWNGDGFENAER